MNFNPVFDYDASLPLSEHAVTSHEDAVRYVTAALPPDFYDRTHRTLSLTSWLPWPGQSAEMVPDEAFEFYCTTEDAQRVPSITSFHGHLMLMPVVHIEYLGRSRKFIRCLVSFVRRKWDAERGETVTETWLTVPGVQGDNNHIRLLEVLPGETDLDLDQTVFFTETPDEMELDFETRAARAYGQVLTELM